MTFLKRLFGRPSVPEWASFFKPEQFDRFISLVEGELGSRGFAFHTNREAGVIAAARSGNGEPHRLGLLNLAQQCAQNPEAEWPELVGEHVAAVVWVEEHEAVMESLKADFEQARELLKVRLYDADMLNSLPEADLVYWQPAEGLIAVLTFDLPTTIVTVSSDFPGTWGRDREELFRIGLENVRVAPLQAEEVEIGDGLRITLLASEGEDHFTASHALFLEDHLDPIPELGTIVAIPHRHVLLLYPLRDAAVLSAIQLLIPIAMGMHEQGPGSISPHLFWWHRGELTCLPTAVEGNTIQFQPPRVFVEGVLSRVAEAT